MNARWMVAAGVLVAAAGLPSTHGGIVVYEEGDQLIVGRATARLHDFPEFEIILVLPDLDRL